MSKQFTAYEDLNGKCNKHRGAHLISCGDVLIGVQVLATASLIYGLVCAAVWLGMRRPPGQFLRLASRAPVGLIFTWLPVEILWKSARTGALRIGDPAPDFRLPTVNQTNEVALSSHRGVRPVVLIFGSYT
jgi:hypothetical protein